MEHHQPGMPQPMGHMAGEIPPYAQHHHVATMYHHHSPTHTGNSRGGNYSQASRGNPIPSAPVEHPVTSTAPSEPFEPEHVMGDKPGDGDISQSFAAGHHHSRDSSEVHTSSKKESEFSQQNQKKSLVNQNEPEPETISPAPPAPPIANDTSTATEPAVVVDKKNEPLSEPSRDTEVIERISAPQEKQSKGVSGSGNGVARSNVSQVKGTSPPVSSSSNPDNIVVENCKDIHSVNGDIKDIKTGKGAPRDKLSAESASAIAPANLNKDNDGEARQTGKPVEVKSNKNFVSVNASSSSRSVNVSNSSTVVVATSSISPSAKEVSEKALESSENASSGEFPQLSSNNNANNTSSSSSVSPSSSNNGSATKGRSWASIASVKSQLASNDGANNTKRMTGASIQGIEQSGDAAGGNGRLTGAEPYSNFVPSSQNESLAKFEESDALDVNAISDKNDPIALTLGEYLRNYTLDHHSIALTPRGLCNQGNYCYINATLQVSCNIN